MFYTYILRSVKNNQYYVGSCNNLDKRVSLHNKGLVKSTKRYAPWDIMLVEMHKTLKEARARETQIKNWKSRKSIESLMKHFKKLK